MYMLRLYPEKQKQLFDWSMILRMSHSSYDSDNHHHLKKKRDAERLTQLEEEEKNRVETRKRKFFAEFQLQMQASQKHRKQRNYGAQVPNSKETSVVNWHPDTE